MILELWMIVGVGVAFAIGCGAVVILLLGLHAQIRRLSQVAETAQRLLAANLRQAVAAEAPKLGAATTPTPRPAPPASRIPSVAATPPSHAPPSQRPPAAATAEADSAAPLANLSAATIAADDPAEPTLDPAVAAANLMGWHPDRRLLVMRLASRGRTPDQIASALRIPQQEVQEFLESNHLLPAAKTLETTP